VSIPKKRILILDDDPDVREVLVEIVRTYGFNAIPVESARDAISTLTRQSVHLIILDLSMPEISGDQFLGFIRKKGAETPVMVVSGHVAPEIEESLREAGVRVIVKKPFEVASIIDGMEEAMRKTL
jgi:CheY-like chemotaxis protein